MTEIHKEGQKYEFVSMSQNLRCNNQMVENLKKYLFIFKPSMSDSFFLCSVGAELFRVCTDIACLKYSISSSPANIVNLFLFLTSIIGFIFTLIFIVESLLEVLKLSNANLIGKRFNIAFCFMWSLLYLIFTTLFIIFNEPVMLPVVCGYVSMVCYALDSCCQSVRNKKSTSEQYDESNEENDSPIQFRKLSLEKIIAE